MLCSGKVYYDIAGHEDRAAADHIAVARVEMLYPFPENELRELMESYPNLERVVWVQEEPRNMGARAFMRRRMAAILPEDLHYYYVGRQLRAAQSEGYSAAHRKEQGRIVRVALDLEDDVEPDASASGRSWSRVPAGAPLIRVAGRLALVGLALGHPAASSVLPMRRCNLAESPGATPANFAPMRIESGATSTSSSPRSMPSPPRRPRPRGCGCRRSDGSSVPLSANIPASRMKPGKTVVTPTARVRQVLAQPERHAAQAELRGRVERAARGWRPCPTARR